jgi:aerobic carbon-monoxide dehydrogenase small subunit
MPLSLTINGEAFIADRDPMTPLIDILREDLALTGAKAVCREGFCGACMVLIDGEPLASCLIPAAFAAGRRILTIEGVSRRDEPTPLQKALEAHDVVQCGMCFPGMTLMLTSLLAANANPTREEIKHGLAGNICRCTGYERIIDAVLAHAANLRG